MKLFIKNGVHNLNIDKNISSFILSSGSIFREMSFNLFENIEVYDKDIFVNLDKTSIIIYNPFQISLEEKKMQSLLLKDISSQLNDDDKQIISRIEKLFFELMEKLSIKIDYPIDYSSSVNLLKLFQAFDLRFKEVNQNNYLELLISYIKIICVISDIKYVFSFNLLSLLSKSEITLLEKELNILNVYLIDFSIMNNDNINVHYIEDDWFVI